MSLRKIINTRVLLSFMIHIKKTIAIVAALLLWASSFAQAEGFDSLINEAKEEFNKQLEEQDFGRAVQLLERAVELKPNDQQAHYMLGSAYSYLNSKEGSFILGSTVGLTLKASEQFEIVNSMTPRYEGELIFTDPYTKISSAWGTLALKYLHDGKADSVRWAFNEGVRRGGFSKFRLSVTRALFDRMPLNSVFFCHGDDDFFSALCLQYTQNHRTDIKIISTGLLGAPWYTRFLNDKLDISFGYPVEQLDAMSYCIVTEKELKLNIPTPSARRFKYEITSRYGRFPYLYQDDLMVIAFLKANKFKREVYFMNHDALFCDIGLIGASHNELFLVSRINHNRRKMDIDVSVLDEIANNLPYADLNRVDDVGLITNLVIGTTHLCYELWDEDKTSQANSLFQSLVFKIKTAISEEDMARLKLFSEII